MAVEYLACGDLMSDLVELADGTVSEKNIGGAAMYALSGMRLWTKNCKLVCKAGADYKDTYGKWLENNGITQSSVNVAAEHCSTFVLRYAPDGSFTPIPVYSYTNVGYLKTHPEDIDKACEGEAVKAIYVVHYTDAVIWRKLAEVKKKYGFKIMWEIEFDRAFRKRENIDCETALESVKRALEIADMWSINHNEASDLFHIPREDDADIIAEIQKLPVELTLYRVGKRGAYVITPREVYFCESIDPLGKSVDPTGCGNTSTGAAMLSYIEGDHPAMVAAKACIAAGFNAAQRGPYPLYTENIMSSACKLADKYFAKIIPEHQS